MSVKKGGDLSDFERRFEAAFCKSDFLSAGISVAIDFEVESMDFYSDAASKAKDSSARELYAFLSREESVHFQILTDLRESLKHRRLWIKAPKAVVKAPLIFRKRKLKAGIRAAPENSAVLHALHAEKDAQYYYARLAEKIADKQGKAFFLKMSLFEKRHAALLDSLFEQMVFTGEMQLG